MGQQGTTLCLGSSVMWGPVRSIACPTSSLQSLRASGIQMRPVVGAAFHAHCRMHASMDTHLQNVQRSSKVGLEEVIENGTARGLWVVQQQPSAAAAATDGPVAIESRGKGRRVDTHGHLVGRRGHCNTAHTASEQQNESAREHRATALALLSSPRLCHGHPHHRACDWWLARCCLSAMAQVP